MRGSEPRSLPGWRRTGTRSGSGGGEEAGRRCGGEAVLWAAERTEAVGKRREEGRGNGETGSGGSKGVRMTAGSGSHHTSCKTAHAATC